LPTPLFNDLIRRLLDRTAQSHLTLAWLDGECLARSIDAPSRSAFYRFADVVREEFRMAKIATSRRSSMSIIDAMTEGDPEARVKAINAGYAEKLLDRLEDLEVTDPKQMVAFSDGLRTVMQGTFGPKVANARVDALRKQIEERDSRIKLIASELAIKDQKLQTLQLDLETEKAKQRKAAEAIEKVAAEGGGVEAVVDRVREILGVAA